MVVNQKRLLKDSLITFDEYLKLFESLPVIFEKLDDMNELNQLLKIFFSNFIIEPIKKDTFKGSKVSYKLNEPWKGFIESNDFVCGAGKETLTPGLFHGKEALCDLPKVEMGVRLSPSAPGIIKALCKIAECLFIDKCSIFCHHELRR